jgi:hypothetical protein
VDEEFDIGYILGAARKGLENAAKFTYSDFAGIVLTELDSRGKIKLPKSPSTPPAGVSQAFLQTNTRLEALITASYFYLFNHGYATVEVSH